MTEFLVLGALFMGVAIGFWRGHDHGWEKGNIEGFQWGRKLGMELRPKRDAKGRFTK